MGLFLIIAEAVLIGAMFGIAVFQILRRNVIRSAIGLVLLSNAINFFLISSGNQFSREPAYYLKELESVSTLASDPLPQALVLTAIIISMGGFAFVLGLLYVLSMRRQTSNSDEINGLQF